VSPDPRSLPTPDPRGLPPETRRLHEGLIRAVIMAVRAWQDWLKVRSPVDPPQEPK
jgi:hypothetical protein